MGKGVRREGGMGSVCAGGVVEVVVVVQAEFEVVEVMVVDEG